MSILTRCPECGHKYRFDEKHVGRQAKCKNGHVFTVTPTIHPAPSPIPESSESSDVRAVSTLDHVTEPPHASEMVACTPPVDKTYRLTLIGLLVATLLALAGGAFCGWYSKTHPTYANTYLAAAAGDVRELKRMHREGISFSGSYHQDGSELRYVSITDNNGTEVAVPVGSDDTETLLQAAVRHGHLDAVVYLLQAGCDPWGSDDAASSAVALAQSSGRTDILNAILDPANYTPREDGSTPLHEAVRSDCPLGVQLLLEHGARVDVKDKQGNTAIYDAAYQRNEECIKLLLSHGASPEDVERARRDRQIEK